MYFCWHRNFWKQNKEAQCLLLYIWSSVWDLQNFDVEWEDFFIGIRKKNEELTRVHVGELRHISGHPRHVRATFISTRFFPWSDFIGPSLFVSFPSLNIFPITRLLKFKYLTFSSNLSFSLYYMWIATYI